MTITYGVNSISCGKSKAGTSGAIWLHQHRHIRKNYEGRGIPHIASRAYRAVRQPAVAILSRLEGAYQYITRQMIIIAGASLSEYSGLRKRKRGFRAHNGFIVDTRRDGLYG